MPEKRTWLKAMRKEKGLTLDEMGTLVGVSSQAIAYIESGDRNPSVKLAKRIGKVLKFRWLIFFEDEKTTSSAN